MWKRQLSVISCMLMLFACCAIGVVVARETRESLSSTTRSIGWPKSTTPVSTEPLTFVTALTPEPDTSSTTSSIRKDLHEATERQEWIPSYRQKYPSGKLQFTSNENTRNSEFANETLQPEIVYPVTVGRVANKLSSVTEHTESDDYMDFEVQSDEEREVTSASVPEINRGRQSTIEEVLSNLFPHGFTNIFQYSQTMTDQITEVPPPTTLKRDRVEESERIPSTIKPNEEITPINGHGINAVSINNLVHTQEVPSKKPSEYIKSTDTESNHESIAQSSPAVDKDVRMSTTVTREYRRETSPGHMEIVIEKVVHDPLSFATTSSKQNMSNVLIDDPKTTLSETIALPTLLYNKIPSANNNASFISKKIDELPVVVFPDADFLEDFEDVDEDDNQLAESKSVAREVYHKPPESTHYQNTAHHDINIHIIHDDSHATGRRPAIFDTTTKKKFYFTPAPNGSVEDEDEEAVVEEEEEEEAEEKRLPRPPSKGRARIRTHQFFGTTRSPLAKTVTPKIPQKKNEVAPKKTVTFYSPSTPLRTSPTKVTTPFTTITDEPIRLLNSTISNSFAGGPTIMTDITISGPMKHTEMFQAVTRPSLNQMKNEFDGKSVYRIVHPDNGDSQNVTPINVILVPIDSPEDMTPEPLYPTQLPPLMASHLPMTTLVKDDEDQHDSRIYAETEPPVERRPKPKPKVPSPTATPRNKTRKDYRKKHPGIPFTFVEVQKSINIHNKLIKEQGGRLIEEHDVFFNRQRSKGGDADNQPKSSETRATTQNTQKSTVPPESHIIMEPYGDESLRVQTYGELSKNPINVSGNENEDQEGIDGEVSASFRDEQLAYAPNGQQGRVDVESIHHSQPIQEIHTIEEVPNSNYQGPKYEDIKQFAQNANSLNTENYITNFGISSGPSGQGIESLPLIQQAQQPYLLQGIIEKHIPIPYSIPAPVPVPVAIEHYIDRPYPVETIVEKPVPYPVEKIVEKVVEKRVPVEVERIVEKPIEKIVRKYVNRPVGIPIKVPVALQFSANVPTKYVRHPGSNTSPANVSPWSMSPVIGNNLTPLPFSVVRTYYNKMLKKLMPPTASAYKSPPPPPSYIKSRPTAVKPYLYKTGKELKYELKPPPPAMLLPVNSITGSPSGPILTSSAPPANLPKPPTAYDASWDKGARYHYDFSSRPHDLMAAQSIRDNQSSSRNALGNQKGNNFDEFLRWRNGHLLKRSPELGRDLQVEYGFKPPLVPSIEIDDHGIPLKKNSAQRR